MTYFINIKCKKCDEKITIKVNLVDQLRNEIRDLKKQITDMKAMEGLNKIFGGFK